MTGRAKGLDRGRAIVQPAALTPTITRYDGWPGLDIVFVDSASMAIWSVNVETMPRAYDTQDTSRRFPRCEVPTSM